MNTSGRGATDRVAVLDTRGIGPLTSRLKWLTPENFGGVNGDGSLELHGLDVRTDKHTNTLRILLINHRPPINPGTGEFMDATKVGANSTVELFQTEAGSGTMRHIRTFAHDVISTPNRVAWVNDHAFVFTNDHSGKVGAVSPYPWSVIFTHQYSDGNLISRWVAVVLATVTEAAAILRQNLELTSSEPHLPFQMVLSAVLAVSFMFPAA